MTAAALINRAEAEGVRLTVDAGDILAVPPGALSETVKAELREHKPAVVAALEDRARQADAELAALVVAVNLLAGHPPGEIPDRLDGDRVRARAAEIVANSKRPTPDIDTRFSHTLKKGAGVEKHTGKAPGDPATPGDFATVYKKAHAEAKTPGEHRDGEAVEPCRTCHRSAWWISRAGVRVCGVCHPPASLHLVARWETEKREKTGKETRSTGNLDRLKSREKTGNLDREGRAAARLSPNRIRLASPAVEG